MSFVTAFIYSEQFKYNTKTTPLTTAEPAQSTDL